MDSENDPARNSTGRAVRRALLLALRAGLRAQPERLEDLAEELRASLAESPSPDGVDVVEDAAHRAIVAAELEAALRQLRSEFGH
ncbi:hypothetical protein EOD42_09355 [Rhodovarius crocodyli]|uniref:Uncharacterized protein n=1 Tax=Rhodovarius crocodyli TaxID=1979269 RepID=A0A437MG29_9PROT|nr:hypothetical protein [Rhodovarius crocodyli]RVT96616.1 hypothetical protein EOD42_09355 [Rhodovarius crocodyli]